MDIDENIKNIIANTALKFNAASSIELDKVSLMIKQLNDYIKGNLTLSENGIRERLDYLIGYFTLTLDLRIVEGLKIVRARKFEQTKDDVPCYDNYGDLSYPPKGISSLGRCNQAGEQIFYGCICEEYEQGGSVALSEVNALVGERINLIQIKSQKAIYLRYIGIWDYVARKSKPSFLADETWDYFNKVNKFMENEFDKNLLIAFRLTDAFFSDIMRKKGSKRLYNVTSILSSMFLESGISDGILYTSVKAEGYPVFALRAESSDSKFVPIDVISCEVVKDYGYAVYETNILFSGAIHSGKIIWK